MTPWDPTLGWTTDWTKAESETALLTVADALVCMAAEMQEQSQRLDACQVRLVRCVEMVGQVLRQL